MPHNWGFKHAQMAKSNTDLLLDYKKSNKTRRQKIVAASGFSTEQDYLNHLLMPDAVEEETPTVHNVFILDASGSMQGAKLNNAIEGINSEIKELKVDTTINTTQTIVHFSDSSDIQTECFMTPIQRVGHFFCHSRGMTALYQAIAETLIRLKAGVKQGDKVLVKIFTDGQENATRGAYASPLTISNLIKECENSGFTITFMGTAQDVQNIIRNLSVDATNTLVHDNTAKGVKMSFDKQYSSTVSYRSAVKNKEDVSKGFFTKSIGKL